MSHRKKHKMPAMKELTEKDEAVFERLSQTQQPKVVSTGFSGDTAAEELHIYYDGKQTYAIGVGEVENADPFKLKGKVSPAKVQAAYRAVIKKYGDMDDDD